MRFLLAITLLFSVCNVTIAQVDSVDSTKTIISQDTTKHSPKKAALLSTAFPGLGQIYNKKYWKLPLVYGSIGTCIYFAFDNNNKFKTNKQNYLDLLNNDPTNPLLATYRADQDFYHRWRDLSIVGASLFYIIQIVDATVDAHFFDFQKKIDNGISFNISPTLVPTNTVRQPLGLKLSIKL